jgi:hypothetical protein
MQPMPVAKTKTAIPPRFTAQRARVLRILARWERATLGQARRLVPGAITLSAATTARAR